MTNRPQRGPNGPSYGTLVANHPHVELALSKDLSVRKIAKIFGCGRSSVREFIERKEKRELELKGLDPSQITLYPECPKMFKEGDYENR